MKMADSKGTVPLAPFRAEGSIHEILMNAPPPSQVSPARPGQQTALPEAVFPRYPELLHCDDEQFFPLGGQRHWTAGQIKRSIAAWAVPYFRSRILPGEFHPLIAYLFNEWKCNLDCHYCWAFDNKVAGMSEEIARRSIDWLHDTGCRVLALMGGEPLLRPRLTHKIVYYAAKRGFFVYLATNGRLLRPEIIDRLADAGISTVNLAVDTWDVKPGLPKAMVPIRANFDYLVRKQYKYGYTVFLNINICRNNLSDVRVLTELANGSCIATDYHICESPMTEQLSFDHMQDNPTFIRREDHAQVTELIDWLIERQRNGYKMVNSVQRLAEMKKFMRGSLGKWGCRAGQNSIVIRVDGTLAPCFPVYNTVYDWGTIERPRFDPQQLKNLKCQCEHDCFSTLNHILAFCYNDGRVIRWLLRQAAHGFQGIRGNMD
jgi:MoaA/NifB/PqqE/SkfB family radical SAM enzyme